VQQRENKKEKIQNHRIGMEEQCRRSTGAVEWAVAATTTIITITLRAVASLMAINHISDGAAVGDAVWDRAGVKRIIGKIQVLQIMQVTQFRRNLPGEIVGLEVQHLQATVAGDS